MENFNAERWSAVVELLAQKQSIISQVTSGLYQPDASGAKIIHCNGIGGITIGDYVKDTDITFQTLTDTDTPINLDKQKYFAFGIDDVDTYSSVADIENAAIIQATYNLALAADKSVFGTFASAGKKINTSATVPLDVSSANIEDVVLTAKEYLDTQDAGGDRVLIVSSPIENKLIKAGYARQTTEGDGIYTNGYIGKLFGFDIYSSNSLTLDAGTSGYHCLALTKRAIPFASLVSKVDTVKFEKRFGNGIKGLYVFGHAVRHPTEMVDLFLKSVPEA